MMKHLFRNTQIICYSHHYRRGSTFDFILSNNIPLTCLHNGLLKRSNETPLKIFFINPANCQNVKLSKLEFDFHEIFVTIKFFVASPNATTGTFVKSQNGIKESLTQNLFPQLKTI